MDINTRAARRLLSRFLTAAGIAAGVAAVGSAQQPTGPRARGVTLLPPRPLEAHEKPPLARGAMDDLPFTAPPVQKGAYPPPAPRTTATPAGPAWLTGVPDPNVRPAAGISRPAANTPRSAAQPTDGAPGFMSRGVDKFKSAVGMDKPQPRQQPGATGQPKREVPTASSPFQGMGLNGAPVYAGPPAYRWFGYGSVTPGANTLAPNGQYPRPSADWHRLTGATPGAIPVPVSNTGVQAVGGVEPPAYAQPVVRPQAPTTPPPAYAPPPEPSRVASSPVSADLTRFIPAPAAIEPPPAAFVPPPVSIEPPKFVPTPAPRFEPPPAAPVGVPTITVPPLVALPPAQVEPPKLVLPAVSETGAPPPPDGPTWQATPEKPAPPGTWMKPTGGDGAWQPGAAARPVVRGQAPQPQQPDPVVTLIQAVCRNRAADVDVRYYGTKRLGVCFEIRGEAEATRLVKDISARKELAPFQIDFCVLVK